ACVHVDPTADPLSMALVERDGTRHLSFRFPDTDALLPPSGDGRTLAGPAAIAVSRLGDPLPCAVAATPCASQSGLLACIDELYADGGTCARQPARGPFSHFTALPFPNDFQADCFQSIPPCTVSASELRVAIDAAGNVVAPMDWRGILVRASNIP